MLHHPPRLRISTLPTATVSVRLSVWRTATKIFFCPWPLPLSRFTFLILLQNNPAGRLRPSRSPPPANGDGCTPGGPPAILFVAGRADGQLLGQIKLGRHRRWRWRYRTTGCWLRRPLAVTDKVKGSARLAVPSAGDKNRKCYTFYEYS